MRCKERRLRDCAGPPVSPIRELLPARLLIFVAFALALLATGAPQAAIAQAQAPPGLVSWYPLDSDGRDLTGANPGTVVGGSFVPAKVNNGFQGGNGYVSVADSDSLQPNNITVECWVKATNPGQFAYILSKSLNGGAGSYAFYTASSGLYFYVTTTSSTILSPNAGAGIWDGNFHHIAGTYDRNSVRLYVDGVEVGSGTPHTFPIAYDSGDLIITHFNAAVGGFFNFPGVVDELSIYNRALTAAEIQSIYSAGSAGKSLNHITQLILNPATVPNRGTSTGTVSLQSAVSSDTVVTLHSDNPTALVPASVTIPANQTQADFTITTLPVNVNTVCDISGTFGGATVHAALTIVPDTTAPDTQISGGPAEGETVCGSGAIFTFTGSDDLSPVSHLRFQTRVDGGPWTFPGSAGSASLDGLTDGMHTFEVAAVDEAGNVDASPAARHFLIDASAPVLTNPTATPFDDGSIQFEWTTNKPTTSRVAFRLQGATDYDSTTEDTNYVTTHKIRVYGFRPSAGYEWYAISRDRCGRSTQSDPLTLVTSPDTTPPDTALLTGPHDGGAAQPGDVVFAWSGSDNATPTGSLRYEYKLDSGDWTPTAAAGVTLNITAEGQHTFCVRAIDWANNADPTPALTQFVIDGTAPVITGPTLSNVTSFSAQVAWSTNEPTTGMVQYALGDGPFNSQYLDPAISTNHSLIIGPLSSNKTYRVRVVAQDGAGNQMSSPIVTFTSALRRDLSVSRSDISFSNAAPATGDSITVSAAVRNSGDVQATGTVVFYDNGQEIGRANISLPAYAPDPVSVTSSPVVVSGGLHTFTVQLTNISPGDDIPTNDTASREINVGAPACRVVIGVSNPRTFPGDDSLFTVVVKNTGSQAQSLADLTYTGVSWVTLASTLPGSLAPGEEAEITYRVSTPTTEIGGALTSPSLRPSSLTLNCGSQTFTANFSIEVYNQPVTDIDLTVKDAVTGQPIEGATIALDSTDQQFYTGPDGKPRSSTGAPLVIPVQPGSRDVYAYARNYLPAAINTDGTQPVTLLLQPGQALAVSQVIATPLTPEEIAARGVNLSDPQNYFVYDFIIAMHVGSLPVRNVILPRYPEPGSSYGFSFSFPAGFGGGGFSSGGGGYGGSGSGGAGEATFFYPTNNPDIHTDTWIIIPGDIRILKQFFDATVFVNNNTDFAINEATATLDTPAGIGLPDLFSVPQQHAQSLGTISPRSQKQAQWVVRGDRPGVYRLTGHAAGSLMLGGSAIPLEATLQSGQFEVVRPKLNITFDTPAAVTRDQAFTIGINITNESTIDLYGAQANIKAEKLIGCYLAPGELAHKDIGTIHVGETVHVTFRFISLYTGVIDQVNTYVSDPLVEPPVTVIPNPNQPPVANADTSVTKHDTPVTISVLANDTDPDGDMLTVTQATPGAHGTVRINSDGTVTYSPAAGYAGPDSFTYTISDGQGHTASAPVSLTVTNQAPVAVADTYSINENQNLTINAPGVLSNDTDADGDALVASLVTPQSHGTLVLYPNGSFTYTPEHNYSGTDTFTYQVSDGVTSSAPITVTITIRSLQTPPSALDDTATTVDNTPVIIAVLANDTDPDGDALTVQSVTQGANGTVTINADNTVTYKPKVSFTGQDSFTYTINDGHGNTASATVRVTVNPKNHPPKAQNDNADTRPEVSVIIAVLANDSDSDGDALTVVSVTQGASGKVTINSNGTVTYKPDPNFRGNDTFTYTISDGKGGTDTARVHVHVR